MDGRRHSVDLPISRTLVALRRVRSLRDPSTNSMSKFSALVDTGNWEIDSSKGISLQFKNDRQEGGSDGDALRSKNLGFYGLREDCVDDFELNCGMGKSKLNSGKNTGWVGKTGLPSKTKQVDGSDYCASNYKPLSERYFDDHEDTELDLACTPSSNRFEDLDKYTEPTVESSRAEQADHIISTQKFPYKNQVKSFGVVGDGVSCEASPHASVSDAISGHSAPLLENEEVDDVDDSHYGLGHGISCCWLRTPKFRESYLSYDAEEHPLVSGDVDSPAFYKKRILKHINNEITPYSEAPRCLSEKFRPKSFSELVGQNVVARSLLGAISKGKITSFYLFHGPRGTGKTSASRIFAAALNCLSMEEHKPCGLCRECVLFFSGRSMDVKEVDSVRINRITRVRSLFKSAANPPVSSRFKVFIIDECQLLRGETWAAVLNSLDSLSQHVIFVMITPDLDSVPRSALSRSQRYHFPKIKDLDIANRLEKICTQEGLDFDQAALNFIASKSNGSLRDAEMILDQLSLLGKKITMALAYELIGIVSDDDLLDLLDLALSSDTSNMVIRARELMRSRIDPMQLIIQLANLIMDILAGKCQEGSSEVRRKFSTNHNSEVDIQKLRHGLKILSETEKQFRLSKNQTTWLTVALLRLSSTESSSLDSNDSNLCLKRAQDQVCSCLDADGDFCTLSATGDGSKHLVTSSSDDYKPHKLGIQDDCKGELESIWKRTTDLCQSESLKNFLKKQGNLSSLCVNQGLAVAELEFQHPDHASKAEKSWKQIASSLQSILGCNVEIRINLAHCVPDPKCLKVTKPSFRLFCCSRRMQWKPHSFIDHGSDSGHSEYTSKKAIINDRPNLTSTSNGGCQMPHCSDHRAEAGRTLRNSEGNVLSIGMASSLRSLENDMPKMHMLGVEPLTEEGGGQDLSIHKPEDGSSCFSRILRLQKNLHSSDSSRMIPPGIEKGNKCIVFPWDIVF
ncbi:protein STICHEL-like 2 isoform X3 [Carya illinoinensis]|nr:protein STICHEL-like 2 isoform X3 [Carya illinoinensis]XP_042953530.1 protein STICHEL-like 2 isoform X3 [Carya illinoinensis]XP_042953531.1 protein STICHEL-like 2 isoform X3 [Carya illinoinensis]XP_042953532.1 protein STICHEL-like 2 isoform X3 [Carya illinoinensis]XP_042953533.1 protein STICHEL-like 2 isoform X3 [Carya illinoinensis]XP_042953534.1 protein STICHEL-like 2 isoform X3 [Carya illinoinensis]